MRSQKVAGNSPPKKKTTPGIGTPANGSGGLNSKINSPSGFEKKTANDAGGGLEDIGGRLRRRLLRKLRLLMVNRLVR